MRFFEPDIIYEIVRCKQRNKTRVYRTPSIQNKWKLVSQLTRDFSVSEEVECGMLNRKYYYSERSGPIYILNLLIVSNWIWKLPKTISSEPLKDLRSLPDTTDSFWYGVFT